MLLLQVEPVHFKKPSFHIHDHLGVIAADIHATSFNDMSLAGMQILLLEK